MGSFCVRLVSAFQSARRGAVEPPAKQPAPGPAGAWWRAAPACVVLAVLAFFSTVLFSSDCTFPWDFRSYHLPLATAYADALAEGTAPLWEPYSYSGRPLLANPQVAAFYPGMFLAVWPGRAGLLERLEWLAVLHVILTGLLVLLLARRLGCGPLGSLLAAVSFALGGWSASQIEHLGIVLSTPWLVLSWLACFARPSWRLPLWSLAWSLCFLAGFPAFVGMTLATTVLVAALLCTGGRWWWSFLGAAALAAAMVSMQLLPTLELFSQSVGKYRSDWLIGGGGIAPAALQSMLHPNALRVFNLSGFRGPGDVTQCYLYAGIVPLAAALWSLRRQNWLLAAATGTFLVLMLGAHTPVGRTIHALLPPTVRGSVYWYVFAAPFLLGVALLAARGLPQRAAWAAPLCLLAGIELIGAGAGRPFNLERMSANPELAGGRLDGSAEAAQTLRALAGDLRMDTADDGIYVMSGAPVLRWRAANGYDPLALERYIQLRLRAARGARWGAYYQIERPDSPALDLMSVRVLTSRKRLVSSRLTEHGQVHGRWVYLNPHALPRFRAPHCALTQVVDSRNRVTLTADCESPSRMETSEPYYTAWKASIDGAEVPIRLFETAFRSVDLPAGRHQLTMWYSARRIWAGVLLSALAWCGWSVAAWRAAKRRS